MTTQSITSITDEQRKQYKRFVEDAADKALAEAGLDKDGLQKLFENGDEFQARIVTGIKDLSVSNQFVDEEVESSYAYPKGYKVKGITEQTNILRQLFQGLGTADGDRKIKCVCYHRVIYQVTSTSHENYCIKKSKNPQRSIPRKLSQEYAHRTL